MVKMSEFLKTSQKVHKSIMALKKGAIESWKVFEKDQICLKVLKGVQKSSKMPQKGWKVDKNLKYV